MCWRWQPGAWGSAAFTVRSRSSGAREESIIGHHKRHPYILRTRWGARRDGKLTAAEVELIADGGAYAYTSTKVMGNATLMCTGPYEIPNVKVDSYAVYTNNLPNGAFRGFGGPQGAFAAETQMNRLAEALGMDPVEIRRRNLLNEDSLLSVGTTLPKGVSIRQVVDACADRMKQSAEVSYAVARSHPLARHRLRLRLQERGLLLRRA